MAPDIALNYIAEYEISCPLLGNLLVHLHICTSLIYNIKIGKVLNRRYENKLIYETYAYMCSCDWQPIYVWKGERGGLVLKTN